PSTNSSPLPKKSLLKVLISISYPSHSGILHGSFFGPMTSLFFHLNEKLWIHIPFNIYHAWIIVVLFLSAFAAFSPSAITYAEEFDFIAPIVIAWSLYGIAAGQEDEFIHWSAIAIGTISALYIFKPLVFKYIIRRPDN
ncbi:16253_t:CDS:2, partial [Cetraspora pellucida]